MAQLTSSVNVSRVFAGNVLTAAGSSAVDGLATNSVPIANWDGVLFVAHVVSGGTGGVASLSVRQTTSSIAALTSGGQGTAPLLTTSQVTATSSATAESLVVDVYKPRQGNGAFLHGQFTTASSCTVLGPVYAVMYGPRTAATTTALLNNNSQAPQSTAASSFSATAGTTLSGITGGVVRAVSPST